MKVISHSRAIEYQIELSAEEAVEFYWAIDDLVSRLYAFKRNEFPKLRILFEIYDELYQKGIFP